MGKINLNRIRFIASLCAGYRRIRNYVHDIGHVFLNRQLIPESLYIETTNICNANCIFCAYQYYKKPKEKMSEDMLVSILSEYKSAGGREVNMTPFAGEILADRDILKKIKLISSFGFQRVLSYTNLILLDKYDVDEFLEAGITDLNISLAPLDRETYIRIFRNKQYDRLLTNLKRLLIAFNQNNRKSIKNLSLEFRSDRTLSECQQLPDYKTHVQPYLNRSIAVSAMSTYDSWMGAISKADLLPGMNIKDPDFPKLQPCSRLSSIQVLSNGEIRACGCRYNNLSDQDIFKLGEIRDMSVLTAYNSPALKALKKSFFVRRMPDECRKCSWYSAA